MAQRKSLIGISAQLTDQADEAAHFLRVLANGIRLRVLCLLLEGAMSVGEINRVIKVSQAVLSQHLGVLRDNNLVCTRRSAQSIFYSVAPGPVKSVIVALHEAYCQRQRPTLHAADRIASPRGPRKSTRIVARTTRIVARTRART